VAVIHWAQLYANMQQLAHYIGKWSYRAEVSMSMHSEFHKPRRIRVRSVLYKFVPNNAQSLIDLRKRLRSMRDTDLQRFIRASEYMCSPGGNFSDDRRESFEIQLREAKEEWKRRNVEQQVGDSFSEHLVRASVPSRALQ
jgi:hypothetical protein